MLSRLKYFWKVKFKIILLFLILCALFLGSLIVSYIFYDVNTFIIDFKNKSYLLASLGIINSALIASFSMLSTNETNNNKEEYKNLKYMFFQLDILDEYIQYSITWIEKFINDEKELLRLNEFINKIHDVKKEILSRELIFTYKRGLQDYGMSKIIVGIDEIYTFKNSYGVSSMTFSDLSDALTGLSLTLMMVKNGLSEKLDIYEKNKL